MRKLDKKPLNAVNTDDLLIFKKEYSQFQWIKFKCTQCGKPAKKQLKQANWQLLCRSCKISNGVRASAKDAVDKRRKTCIERYGTDSYVRTTEYKEKTSETCKEKYGVSWPTQSERSKSAAIKTNIKRRGVPYVSQSPEWKDKVKETNLEKFGTEWASQNNEIKDKVRETFQRNYGVDNISQSEDCKQKVRETIENKYGTQIYAGMAYDYDDKVFDSSWELAYYVWLKDSGTTFEYHPDSPLEYFWNGRKYKYFPDFLVDGHFIEIKGNQFFDENGVLITPFKEEQDGREAAKQRCMIENHVQVVTGDAIKPYLKYVAENYGKDFLRSLRRI